MLTFTDARDALTNAYAQAPVVIGYTASGWTIYPPSKPPEGVAPELLVVARGRLPLPLSDDGAAVLASIVRAAARSTK